MTRFCTLLTLVLFLSSTLAAQPENIEVLLYGKGNFNTPDTLLFSPEGQLQNVRTAAPKSRKKKGARPGSQRTLLVRSAPNDGSVLRVDSTFLIDENDRRSLLLMETTVREADRLVVALADAVRVRSRKTYLLDENGNPYRLSIYNWAAERSEAEQTTTYVYDWENNGKVTIVGADDGKKKYVVKWHKTKENYSFTDWTATPANQVTYMFNKSNQLRMITNPTLNRSRTLSYHESGWLRTYSSDSTSPTDNRPPTIEWKIKKSDIPLGLPRAAVDEASRSLYEYMEGRNSAYRMLFPDLLGSEERSSR